MSEVVLTQLPNVFIRQSHEIGELLGFETRNKYRISDDLGNQIGYAAEQQKGILGFLLRQLIGHWRCFDILLYGNNQQLWLRAHHPFRFYFKRIELFGANDKKLGAIQKRFSFFTKQFDFENERGVVTFSVSSPIWKIWTFTINKGERVVGEIQKKWSGILSEAITDKDNFLVTYNDPSLTQAERELILVAAIYVDLLYFEKKS